jgi:hypothetical protein
MNRIAMQRTLQAAMVALTLALACLPQAVRAQANLLDGKAFAVTEGEAGKPAERENLLSFGEGKFHSKACDEWGYDKGVVKATQEGEVISFETETRSEKYGTRQVWMGTIRGDTIEGTRLMYGKPWFFNKNPTPKEGWFKGTLKTN